MAIKSCNMLLFTHINLKLYFWCFIFAYLLCFSWLLGLNVCLFGAEQGGFFVYERVPAENSCLLCDIKVAGYEVEAMKWKVLRRAQKGWERL